MVTVPVDVTNTLPSTASVDEAPNSVYISSTSRFNVEDPFNVITGAIVSFIVTMDDVVAKLLAASVAVHKTVVDPRPNECGA